MSMQVYLTAAAVSLALGFAAPSYSAEPASAAYTFAFQQADIALVAQEIFGELGVAYVVDPAVTGKMSFRIDRKLTKAQLLQAFEAALGANNVAVVREGDSLLLVPREKAKASAVVRALGEGTPRAGYETVAVPLTFIAPSEAQKALEAIAGEGRVVYANDALGLIILGGSAQELETALATLRIFDQSTVQGSKVRWLELAQAPAAAVAAEIESLLQAGGMVGVKVAALKRMNGLIVFSRSAAALDEVAQWVRRLDVPARDATSALFVYRPKYAAASGLARSVGLVLGGGATDLAPASAATVPASGGSGGAGAAMAPSPAPAGATALGGLDDDGAMRVAVDPLTNTLLFSGPSWRWIQVQRILAELDRPQSQVLIEASIIEVRLTKELRWGVDWSVVGSNGELVASNVSNEVGEIGPSYPGFSITYLGADIQAAVTALGARTNVEVISAPKLVTLDNHRARLQVGDQVPVVTQTSRSLSDDNAPLVNSVDYRDSGVILNVTPRISGENRVIIDVAQEVSAVIQTRSSGIDSPTIQQRRLESTLVLDDGAVVALGGLIGQTRNRGRSGIPGLSSLPAIGPVFGSTSRDETRTELIVLLKAKILRDPQAARRATDDLLLDLKEIQSRGLVG